MEERRPFSLTFPGGAIRFDPVRTDAWQLYLERDGKARPMGQSDTRYLRGRLLPWLLSPDVPQNDYGWLLSLFVDHHSLYVFDAGGGSVRVMVESDTGREVDGFVLDPEELARWRTAVKLNLPEQDP